MCVYVWERPLKPLKGLESWINTIAFVSLLADETVSSFETENMQSDSESQRDTERQRRSRRAVFHFCGCRHVKATSGFCILSQELTVQLTGQVCVSLQFIPVRPACVCVGVEGCVCVCVGWVLRTRPLNVPFTLHLCISPLFRISFFPSSYKWLFRY